MFLQLNHQRLEVFKISQTLVSECYKQTKGFPAEEKFALVQQIRRAALSVYLNIAEGCSRKSEQERKRYFEVSRGSLIEIDAAFDIVVMLNYCQKENLQALGACLLACFKMLSSLLKSSTDQ